MADIELVIKIPEWQYKTIKDNKMGISTGITINALCAIQEGTPLPKGHGRLIDADRLKEEMEKDVRRAMSFVDLTDFVLLAPTIIAEDKEQE